MVKLAVLRGADVGYLQQGYLQQGSLSLELVFNDVKKNYDYLIQFFL